MISKYRKAIVGFVGAAAAALVAAYLGDQSISAGEWLDAVIAAFATLGVVIQVPNAGQVYASRATPRTYSDPGRE